MIAQTSILRAIDALDLSGHAVCIHSSLRSFGAPIDGGADALANCFLSRGCTVMAPSFSYEYAAPPAAPFMPAQNGTGDYSYFFGEEYPDMPPFSPSSVYISQSDMGIFPARLLLRDGHARGDHPLNSFVALGPQAHRLVDCQTARDVYAPFRQLCADDGFVLLIGVDLDRATILHYAEQLSGRTPFVRWARSSAGQTIPVSVGSCSEGFPRLAPALAPAQRTLILGQSVWRCWRAREIVELARREILRDPRITHCGDNTCDRCNDAVLGGPTITFPF